MQETTHQHYIDDLTHDHIFDPGSNTAERGTRLVMWITAAMMVVEIAAGWWFNSMALLADGWHMSSHALAIGLSAFAYSAARKYAKDPRFAFGTWKIEVLAGYTSAVFLLGIAALMAFSSIERIFTPESIHYREAIVIAVIGLVVNVICATILGHAHHHHNHEHHHHGHHGYEHRDGRGSTHGHHDLNLKSAYIHVIADAATSVLAIGALAGGWAFGWSWLDPVMGIVGAVLVAAWARNLIVETGKVLLDREMDAPVVDEIRQVVSSASTSAYVRLVDLHVWRVGKQFYSCALSVVTNDQALTPTKLREHLGIRDEIVHATIEVHYQPSNAV